MLKICGEWRHPSVKCVIFGTEATVQTDYAITTNRPTATENNLQFELDGRLGKKQVMSRDYETTIL